jgi:CrcB protein
MPYIVMQYFLIGLGGALGSMGRFALASLIDTSVQKTGYVFPWGTIIVNITGCFVIGLVATVTAAEGRFMVSTLTRQFVMIGILGGYTTFSSFSYQTLQLAQDSQWSAAAANVLISVVLCLVGTWLGIATGNALNQLR